MTLLSHLRHAVLGMRLLVGLLALILGGFVPATARGESEPSLTPAYLIEAIHIRGNTKTKDQVIHRALRISPGERLSVDDPRFELSRYRVLSLGHFSDVRLRLEKGSSRGHVLLVVEVVERGTILLTEVFLGTSEATRAWGGLGVTENNFLGRGISIEGAFVLGSDPEVERSVLQQSYLLRARKRQIGNSPFSLSMSFLFLDGCDFFRRSGPEETSDPADFLSIRYRRIGATLGTGFDIARFTRMYVEYRGEAVSADLPTGAVRRDPNGTGEPISFGIPDGDSVLSIVSVGVERDTRSDPVLPQRGSLLNVSGEASNAIFGSSYNYFKLMARYDVFFPMRWGHILSLQLRGGAIFGQAPFFERFFIGDWNDLVPSRALGLNFSTLPSRNIFGTSIAAKRYEEIALRTSLEYIIPWFRGGHFAYGGDFFLNVGLILLTSRRDLQLRDRDLSESIPVDLTLDAGLRLDTRVGIFRFSIGNFLGRIPF